jgi:hypothetical protein
LDQKGAEAAKKAIFNRKHLLSNSVSVSLRSIPEQESILEKAMLCALLTSKRLRCVFGFLVMV